MSDSDTTDEQDQGAHGDWVSEPSHEPQDRLTFLCADMMKALETPENEGIKGIVMLEEVHEGRSRNGLMLSGYEDDAEALTAMYMHIRAAFKAHGYTLQLLTREGMIT